MQKLADRLSGYRSGSPLVRTDGRHYPVSMIGRADGLSTGQVHRLATDTRGRLWLATPNGLSCSDGSRISTLTKNDGLSTHGMRCVATGPTGDVWAGSDVGLDRIRPDGTIECLIDGWSFGLANDVAVAPDGSVWAASAMGLVHWTVDGGWNVCADPIPTDGTIHRVAIDWRGRVWAAGGHRGLLVPDGPTWAAPESDAWRSVGRVLCVAPLADGTVVVGGSDGAVNIDALGAVVRELDTEGAPVHAAAGAHGELWVGTATELRCFTEDGSSWVAGGSVADGIRVNHIEVDAHGNVWAATDSEGVVKIEVVRRAIERPDLRLGSVFAIRPSANGDLLTAGDRRCGRTRFDDAAWFGSIDELADEKVWDLVEDRRGALWVASDAGLLRIDEGGTTQIGVADAILAAPARALLERRDHLLVGTLSGLARVDAGGAIESIVDERGRSLGYVYTLVADGDTVWVGTLGNGLWRLTGDGCSRVRGDGLLETGNSYAIAVHAAGTVAALQDDRIVFIGPDGSPRLVHTTSDALVGWAAAFDHADSLWVGSSSGLVEYCAATGDFRRRVTLWMGVDGWEFTTSRSLHIDDTGRIFCGLNSGLAIVDPAAIAELAPSAEVELAAMSWSNVEPTTSDGLVWSVPNGRWTFEASVFSTWPLREASRLFRFRLLGFQPDWSEPRSSPQIRFSSLPPGGYTLQAQAHSGLLGWGPTATIAVLDVRRKRSFGPAGTTRSARALRRLAGENHELEQRVRERTMELTEAHAQLERANRELAELSLRDPLTGVANRRQFDRALAASLDGHAPPHRDVSVLMVDVDDFKAFNDELGHPEGDRSLRRIAAAMAGAVRTDLDLVARYGGEEFTVLLPGVGRRDAMVAAERVRAAVVDEDIYHPRSSVTSCVTVTVGVATADSWSEMSPRDLVALADRALYEAKRAGRNRSFAVPPSSDAP